MENRRKELMNSYNRGNMDLFIYQATIGNAYINNLNRITDDVDPDPYGTGACQDQMDDDEHEEFSQNDSYHEDEIQDELIELTFENDLCLKVQEKIVEKPKQTCHPRKVLKNKRQKPNPNSRKSDVYNPAIQNQLEATESGLAGAALRERRIQLDELEQSQVLVASPVFFEETTTDTAEEMIQEAPVLIEEAPVLLEADFENCGTGSALVAAAAAVALTASVINITEGSENDEAVQTPKEPEKVQSDFELNNAWLWAMKKIEELKFKLSPTQLLTPSDGNCLYHAIADQSYFKDHLEARRTIVENGRKWYHTFERRHILHAELDREPREGGSVW